MAKANRPPKPPKPGNGGGTTNPIPPVTGLFASLTVDNKVYLQWNPLEGATSYWVRRDIYVPAIIQDTKYTDGSVKPQTTYSYRIAAVVGGRLGPDSSPAVITTN